MAKAKKKRKREALTIRLEPCPGLVKRVRQAAARDGNRPVGNWARLILTRACEESELKRTIRMPQP